MNNVRLTTLCVLYRSAKTASYIDMGEGHGDAVAFAQEDMDRLEYMLRQRAEPNLDTGGWPTLRGVMESLHIASTADALRRYIDGEMEYA